MTPELLDACTGCGIMVAESIATSLTVAMGRASVVTPLRQAAFLAQVGHESNGFQITRENMNYSAAALLSQWPLHFNTGNVDQYVGKPQAIANRAYANRMGNGDEASGDGWLCRGGGYMQLTGRADFMAASSYCGVDLVANPDAFLDPDVCALTASWEWERSGLNAYADKEDLGTINMTLGGKKLAVDEFYAITEKINGGQIGSADRWIRYVMARKGLMLPAWVQPLGNPGPWIQLS